MSARSDPAILELWLPLWVLNDVCANHNSKIAGCWPLLRCPVRRGSAHSFTSVLTLLAAHGALGRLCEHLSGAAGARPAAARERGHLSLDAALRPFPCRRLQPLHPNSSAILELWLPLCPFPWGSCQPQLQDRGGRWGIRELGSIAAWRCRGG